MPNPMAPSPTNPILLSSGIKRLWQPAETFFGSICRAIFATDPTLILQRIDGAEQMGKIDFAHVRLPAIGDSRKLEMPDFWEKFLSATRQIATHNLCVIPIKL